MSWSNKAEKSVSTAIGMALLLLWKYELCIYDYMFNLSIRNTD